MSVAVNEGPSSEVARQSMQKLTFQIVILPVPYLRVSHSKSDVQAWYDLEVQDSTCRERKQRLSLQPLAVGAFQIKQV